MKEGHCIYSFFLNLIISYYVHLDCFYGSIVSYEFVIEFRFNMPNCKCINNTDYAYSESTHYITMYFESIRFSVYYVLLYTLFHNLTLTSSQKSVSYLIRNIAYKIREV